MRDGNGKMLSKAVEVRKRRCLGESACKEICLQKRDAENGVEER